MKITILLLILLIIGNVELTKDVDQHQKQQQQHQDYTYDDNNDNESSTKDEDYYYDDGNNSTSLLNNQDLDDSNILTTTTQSTTTTTQAPLYKCPVKCKCQTEYLNQLDNIDDHNDYNYDDNGDDSEYSYNDAATNSNDNYKINVDCSNAQLTKIKNLFDENFPFEYIKNFNLSLNRLKQIDISDFEYANSIEILDLSFNSHLRQIPLALFKEYLPNIRQLNLNNLNLQCDCKFKRLFNYFNEKQIELNLNKTKCLSAASTYLSQDFIKNLKCINKKNSFNINIEPNQSELLVYEGDSLKLKCFLNRKFKNITLNWYFNDTKVNLNYVKRRNDTFIELNKDRLSLDEDTGVYKCSIEESANKSMQIFVKILRLNSKNMKYCEPNKSNTYKGTYTWPRTRINTTILQNCSFNAGIATNECNEKQKWVNLNLQQCDFESNYTRYLQKYNAKTTILDESFINGYVSNKQTLTPYDLLYLVNILQQPYENKTSVIKIVNDLSTLDNKYDACEQIDPQFRQNLRLLIENTTNIEAYTNLNLFKTINRFKFLTQVYVNADLNKTTSFNFRITENLNDQINIIDYLFGQKVLDLNKINNKTYYKLVYTLNVNLKWLFLNESEYNMTFNVSNKDREVIVNLTNTSNRRLYYYLTLVRVDTDEIYEINDNFFKISFVNYKFFPIKFFYFSYFLTFSLLLIIILFYLIKNHVLLMPRKLKHCILNKILCFFIIFSIFSIGFLQFNLKNCLICVLSAFFLQFFYLCLLVWFNLYFYEFYTKIKSLSENNKKLRTTATVPSATTKNEKKFNDSKKTTKMLMKDNTDDYDDDDDDDYSSRNIDNEGHQKYIPKPVIQLYMIGYGIPAILCSIIISSSKRYYLYGGFSPITTTTSQSYCFTNNLQIQLITIVLPLIISILINIIFFISIKLTLNSIMKNLKEDEKNENEESEKMNEAAAAGGGMIDDGISECTSVMDAQFKPHTQMYSALACYILFILMCVCVGLLLNQFDFYIYLNFYALLQACLAFLLFSFYFLCRDDVLQEFNTKRIKYFCCCCCFKNEKFVEDVDNVDYAVPSCAADEDNVVVLKEVECHQEEMETIKMLDNGEKLSSNIEFIDSQSQPPSSGSTSFPIIEPHTLNQKQQCENVREEKIECKIELNITKKTTCVNTTNEQTSINLNEHQQKQHQQITTSLSRKTSTTNNKKPLYVYVDHKNGTAVKNDTDTDNDYYLDTKNLSLIKYLFNNESKYGSLNNSKNETSV